MKPVSKFVLATAAFTVTGVALACTVLPMLPFSISVDLKDIAAAKQAGASFCRGTQQGIPQETG